MKDNEIEKIVIIGAGGAGIDALWTIEDCNRICKKYDVIGFIDDNKKLEGRLIKNLSILGGVDWFNEERSKKISAIIAIGDGKLRKKIAKRLEKFNVRFPTIIHPSAIHSELNQTGKGCLIQAGSIFGADTRIENFVIVNMDCTIGHGSVLKDFVTVSPGVHINGDNTLEIGTLIGAGATTNRGLRIGKWSLVSIGSVVGEDVPDGVMVMGNPARPIKRLN